VDTQIQANKTSVLSYILLFLLVFAYMLTTLTTLTTLAEKNKIMFTYPLTHKDALKTLRKFLSDMDSGVQFDNPILVQLYWDQDQGLCTIVRRDSNADDINVDMQDSVLEISYHDPELEFVRKLQC
jgi:hypothetical protein